MAYAEVFYLALYMRGICLFNDRGNIMVVIHNKISVAAVLVLHR